MPCTRGDTRQMLSKCGEGWQSPPRELTRVGGTWGVRAGHRMGAALRNVSLIKGLQSLPAQHSSLTCSAGP